MHATWLVKPSAATVQRKAHVRNLHCALFTLLSMVYVLEVLPAPRLVVEFTRQETL